MWPYLSEGKCFSDAPDLVVAMPGYEAPFRWTEHLLSQARRDLIKIMPIYDRVLPVREVSLAPDVMLELPQYPTQASNRAFRDWCERVGHDLLLMGGLGQSGCEGLLYAGPLPHPLTWDTPGPVRPCKTFERTAR